MKTMIPADPVLCVLDELRGTLERVRMRLDEQAGAADDRLLDEVRAEETKLQVFMAVARMWQNTAAAEGGERATPARRPVEAQLPTVTTEQRGTTVALTGRAVQAETRATTVRTAARTRAVAVRPTGWFSTMRHKLEAAIWGSPGR